MGKVPWDTIRRNIPNGGLIACRVPADHLIVAGVSNWGAYALAAGVLLPRGEKGAAGLSIPTASRELLRIMVEQGPLVDGVSGQATAIVDGLSWEQYAEPLCGDGGGLYALMSVQGSHCSSDRGVGARPFEQSGCSDDASHNFV